MFKECGFEKFYWNFALQMICKYLNVNENGEQLLDVCKLLNGIRDVPLYISIKNLSCYKIRNEELSVMVKKNL